MRAVHRPVTTSICSLECLRLRTPLRSAASCAICYWHGQRAARLGGSTQRSTLGRRALRSGILRREHLLLLWRTGAIHPRVRPNPTCDDQPKESCQPLTRSPLLPGSFLPPFPLLRRGYGFDSGLPPPSASAPSAPSFPFFGLLRPRPPFFFPPLGPRFSEPRSDCASADEVVPFAFAAGAEAESPAAEGLGAMMRSVPGWAGSAFAASCFADSFFKVALPRCFRFLGSTSRSTALR
jgi:hypothetical protein